jgi:DNA-binding SARP family transcriptional activator
MSFRSFLFVLGLAMAIQATVFSRHYTDLLYLRSPVDVLAQSSADEFKHQAESALTRAQLTRHHLDTIAETARRTNQPDLEVRALERLSARYPADTGITLRLADAWRRAGRLSDAEKTYRRLLAEAGTGQGSAQ